MVNLGYCFVHVLRVAYLDIISWANLRIMHNGNTSYLNGSLESVALKYTFLICLAHLMRVSHSFLFVIILWAHGILVNSFKEVIRGIFVLYGLSSSHTPKFSIYISRKNFLCLFMSIFSRVLVALGFVLYSFLGTFISSVFIFSRVLAPKIILRTQVLS